MEFSVVSERALFRELIASYCINEGIGVPGLFADLSEVPDGLAGSDFILHVPETSNIGELGIADFRSRFGHSRIILLVSSKAPMDLVHELATQVDATIFDDRSLLTLSSFLTVINEGFCISPGQEFHTAFAQGASGRTKKDFGRFPADAPGGSRFTTFELSRKSATQIKNADGTDAKRLARLSPREYHKLSAGVSNKNIANQLNIVESTVKVHLRGCFRKIGVQNRTQAAVWAAQHLPK